MPAASSVTDAASTPQSETYVSNVKQFKWRTAVWGLIFVTLVGTLAFVYFTFRGKYLEHARHSALLVNQAKLLLDQSTCTNAEVRARLGPFNECDKAEMIIARGVDDIAFYEFLEKYQFCDDTACTIFGHNISDVVVDAFVYLFYGLLVAFTVTLIMLLNSCCRSTSAVQVVPHGSFGPNGGSLDTMFAWMAQAYPELYDRGSRRRGAKSD